jgi:hypothetical protein
MYNSRFIGADFDAVMIKGNDMIMTDIKTLTRPLTKKDLLQLISYCLLWSKKDEPPRITHAGIYHGRSGDYKYLPLPDIIRMTLPTFEMYRRCQIRIHKQNCTTRGKNINKTHSECRPQSRQCAAESRDRV